MSRARQVSTDVQCLILEAFAEVLEPVVSTVSLLTATGLGP
jgi:hypothetical protein